MAKKSSNPSLVGEDARKRSVRLANKRVSGALSKLDLIANLGGVGYQLTDDEKDKILKAVDAGVAKIRSRFAGEKMDDQRFKL